jgi:microcystin-dependent protein
MFGGNFAPAGWLPCDGRSVPISDYDLLFNYLGTIYGGDGVSYFNLPDLRGRFPAHNSPSWPVGMTLGSETVTLQQNQLAGHNHALYGSGDPGIDSGPNGHVPASLPFEGATAGYNTRVPFGALDPTSIGPTGGNKPHNNVQPYLCITYIICWNGYPPYQG